MARNNTPPPPHAERVLVTVSMPVQHDGDDYAAGETLECTVDQANALAAAGAVQIDAPADTPADPPAA